MATRAEWMIYGANGYTGPPCGRGGQTAGSEPGAGWSARPQSRSWRSNSVRARGSLISPMCHSAALVDVAIVANCAGPFAITSGPMIDACLKSQSPLCRYHGRDRRLSCGTAAPCRGEHCWNRNLLRRGFRYHSHRLHRRRTLGGPARRNPPRPAFMPEDQ